MSKGQGTIQLCILLLGIKCPVLKQQVTSCMHIIYSLTKYPNITFTNDYYYSEMLCKLQSELEHFPLDKPLPIPGSSCCHKTIPSKIIPNLFEGQLHSEVKYLTCGHTSVTVETFWDLSIDFPERYICNSMYKINYVLNLKISIQNCCIANTVGTRPVQLVTVHVAAVTRVLLRAHVISVNSSASSHPPKNWREKYSSVNSVAMVMVMLMEHKLRNYNMLKKDY